jgi:hypothetical protein
MITKQINGYNYEAEVGHLLAELHDQKIYYGICISCHMNPDEHMSMICCCNMGRIKSYRCKQMQKQQCKEQSRQMPYYI